MAMHAHKRTLQETKEDEMCGVSLNDKEIKIDVELQIKLGNGVPLHTVAKSPIVLLHFHQK